MPRGEHFKGKRPEGAGRKPGTPSKLTADLRQAMADLHADAAKRVKQILADPEAKHADIVRIWEVTGKKLVPDLSAVTLNPDEAGKAAPIQVVINPPAVDSDGDPC